MGILFIGTPHTGVPIASNLALNWIGSDDIKFLKMGGEDIQELQKSFSQISEKIAIMYSIIETDKTPIYGRQKIIVPPESAAVEVGNVYHVKVLQTIQNYFQKQKFRPITITLVNQKVESPKYMELFSIL